MLTNENATTTPKDLLGNLALFQPGWLESIMMQCLLVLCPFTPKQKLEMEQELPGCPYKAELTDSPEEQRVLPMTTKLRSCFPPCRFSSSALTSICCFSLLDFFTGVGIELCSSDAWMVWDGRTDLETASRISEAAMLVSSLGIPFWGVWKLWPFSSAVTLQRQQ